MMSTRALAAVRLPLALPIAISACTTPWPPRERGPTPLPAERTAAHGAYVTFASPRDVVIGRSGGFTRLAAVRYIEGSVTRESPDSLWLVVLKARGSDGSHCRVPLGATTTIARDAEARVTFGGMPEPATPSGRSMVTGSVITLVFLVAVPVVLTWFVFGGGG